MKGKGKGYAAWYYDDASRTAVVSLGPGDQLVASLNEACKDLKIESGVVINGIGSFCAVTYQYGGKDIKLDEKLEILSLSGVIAGAAPHLHVSMIGFDGAVKGGHLYEGEIYTVAEIAIMNLSGLSLRRGLRDGCDIPLLCEP